MGVARILLGRAARAALDAAKEATDPDRLLQTTMAALIEARRAEHEARPERGWRPGAPLSLLLAGYVGSRNTGADVRVEEMIRQLRHLFGDEHLDLSILTIDPEWTRGYFRTVKQLHVPQLFPKFLFDTVARFDGVIACEGSMFKSKFASALTTMMVGALGLALAEDKLAVGYGGEAGAMDESLEAMVKRYVKGALIVTRNVESQKVLDRLGIASRLGTDTAWTLGDPPAGLGEKLLTRAGWDGKQPVLIVCPIHPFVWPVRPDPFKAAAHRLTGAYDDAHFRSIYFHASGPDVEKKQARYLAALSSAVRDFTREKPCFVALVGMEALDRVAVEGFASLYAERYGVTLRRRPARSARGRRAAPPGELPRLVPLPRGRLLHARGRALDRRDDGRAPPQPLRRARAERALRRVHRRGPRGEGARGSAHPRGAARRDPPGHRALRRREPRSDGRDGRAPRRGGAGEVPALSSPARARRRQEPARPPAGAARGAGPRPP
jgi:hypothetical protein